MEPKLLKQSPYYNIDQFIAYLKGKQNQFTVINLNCESLNAKFDELQVFIHELDQNSCSPAAICLQETWLHDHSDLSLFHLENYNLIARGKSCTARGGVAIYLQEEYDYEILDIFEGSEIWEGQFIKITIPGTNKKVILGNIYHPPRDLNDNYELFIREFSSILNKLQKSKQEILIGGDFNIDLLKIHEKAMYATFFDTVTSLGFYPQITLPTRLSQRRGTIIDNFLYKLSDLLTNLTDSGIISSRISDHFPYFIGLDILSTNHDPLPKYTNIRPRHIN